MDKWIERNGHTATYRALAKCLFEAGALDSVHRLCREFGTTSTPTVVPDGGASLSIAQNTLSTLPCVVFSVSC